VNEIPVFIAVFTTVRKPMGLFIFKSSAIRSCIYWYILIGVSNELDASILKMDASSSFKEANSYDIYLFI
jgi:hypothetical protein